MHPLRPIDTRLLEAHTADSAACLLDGLDIRVGYVRNFLVYNHTLDVGDTAFGGSLRTEDRCGRLHDLVAGGSASRCGFVTDRSALRLHRAVLLHEFLVHAVQFIGGFLIEFGRAIDDHTDRGVCLRGRANGLRGYGMLCSLLLCGGKCFSCGTKEIVERRGRLIGVGLDGVFHRGVCVRLLAVGLQNLSLVAVVQRDDVGESSLDCSVKLRRYRHLGDGLRTVLDNAVVFVVEFDLNFNRLDTRHLKRTHTVSAVVADDLAGGLDNTEHRRFVALVELVREVPSLHRAAVVAFNLRVKGVAVERGLRHGEVEEVLRRNASDVALRVVRVTRAAIADSVVDTTGRHDGLAVVVNVGLTQTCTAVEDFNLLRFNAEIFADRFDRLIFSEQSFVELEVAVKCSEIIVGQSQQIVDGRTTQPISGVGFDGVLGFGLDIS